MARKNRENSAAPVVHARHVAQHRRGDLRRIMLHHYLRHRGRVDAVVPLGIDVGEREIFIKVGDARSQDGVSIAVA